MVVIGVRNYGKQRELGVIVDDLLEKINTKIKKFDI